VGEKGKRKKKKGVAVNCKSSSGQADLVDRKSQIKLNARQKKSREKSIE
jgi:hypothetical protein